jgi:hypothetical protein
MHEHARQVVEQIIKAIELGQSGSYRTGGIELMRVVGCGSTPEQTCDTPEKCARLRERLFAVLEAGRPPVVA